MHTLVDIPSSLSIVRVNCLRARCRSPTRDIRPASIFKSSTKVHWILFLIFYIKITVDSAIPMVGVTKTYENKIFL